MQESDVNKFKSNISAFMNDLDSSFLGGSNQGEERDFNKVMYDNDSIQEPVKVKTTMHLQSLIYLPKHSNQY